MSRVAFSILLCSSILFTYHNTHTKAPTHDYMQLAKLHADKGNTEKAITCYRAALKDDTDNLIAHIQLGNLLAHNDRYQEAIKQYQAALALNPKCTSVLYNTAFCLRSLGLFDQAVDTYNNFLYLCPEDSNGRQGRAHALLALGRWAEAWEDFECRWTKPRNDTRHFVHYMHANGNLHGKTVLIIGEFGQGDTLQFIRYGKKLKDLGAHVIAQVQKSLMPLLRLCPYLDTVIPVDTPAPAHDFATVLMSLPWAFKTELDTIPNQTPYLNANEQRRNFWHTHLAHNTNFKIGLCWHGNAYETGLLKKLVEAKSIPLRSLAPLAQLEHISFYSLQKISGLDEIKQLPENFIVHTCGDDFDVTHGPFMDTAAIMQELDLIITIDTSIAHLAGGLGVPVWTLLPHVADWRWMTEREDSPWYPTMRLFRQKTPENWETVVHAIKKELIQELQKRNMPVTKKSPPPSLPLLYKQGVQAYTDGDLTTARDHFLAALEFDPHATTLLYALGLVYRKLGNIPASIAYYEKALQQNPEHTDAAFGLAQSYHTAGNVGDCWRLFNLWRGHEKRTTYPKNLSEISGKHILIRAEWGLGDMMHFIRYAYELRRYNPASITVESHTALVALLRNCPYIDLVIPKGSPLPTADYSIPLLYLPTLFSTTEKTIPSTVPYLYPSTELVKKWENELHHDSNFRVGICWDMGHYDTNLIGWKRAIPLSDWLPLLQTPGVSFYCLQKENLEELQDLPVSIHHFGPTFDTEHGGFMDSAALIKNLDLVITVDTAIAHLAGALGAPVWVMLPVNPDYRWMLDREDTPWYPTIKLFRQTTAGIWHNVIEHVKKQLASIARQKKRSPEQSPTQKTTTIGLPIETYLSGGLPYA